MEFFGSSIAEKMDPEWEVAERREPIKEINGMSDGVNPNQSHSSEILTESRCSR